MYPIIQILVHKQYNNMRQCQDCMPFLAAVKNGDLVMFGEALDRYSARFQAEKTYTLIIRLRHNVIKTGIRMISLSYSR